MLTIWSPSINIDPQLPTKILFASFDALDVAMVNDRWKPVVVVAFWVRSDYLPLLAV